MSTPRKPSFCACCIEETRELTVETRNGRRVWLCLQCRTDPFADLREYRDWASYRRPRAASTPPCKVE